MTSITEFNRQVNIAIPYLAANNARLLYPNELVTNLETNLEGWNTLLPISTNEATRTSIAVANTRKFKSNFEKLYHAMQQSLKNSGAVALTPLDHTQLFIHIDKIPSHVPKPNITPKVDVVEIKTGVIVIQLSDPDLPEFNHRGLPEGVEYANIFIAIVSANAAIPVAEDYHLFATESKSTIDLTFENEDEKKVAYIKAEFGNNSGTGRESDAIDVVIPN